MNSQMFARMCLVFAVPAALGMGGCDAPGEENEDAQPAGVTIVSPEEIAAQDVVELAPEDRPLVAVIDGKKPGMVEFLDVSETDVPEIMVVAVGEEGAGMVSLIDADMASPLELYLAFAGSTEDPPAALFQDHDRLARAGFVSAAPREFQLFREEAVGTACLAGGDPGDDHTDFWAAWRVGFGSQESHGEHGVFSAGMPSGSAIQVSNSTKRAFDACAIHSTSTLHTVKFQTLSGGLWGTISTFTAPNTHQGWGVALRSVSSGSTLTARIVMSSVDGNNVTRIFWGGAFSS